MDEKMEYIGFIVKMLERCNMRKIKIIYEFVLSIAD